ncbi:DEAD/DEAH box helicase family protein [Rhodobacteraceae bacterium 2376]|uniref:DEAD/DEAH box helicase family protein n=1 Tax=Rhabdonatronobacter sediminivivens TaxID=2743469 RepID=A0A7Z0I285_9RHOB|nr:DEAD/DEAH box helicase family protein [Rhabdonatronobacter sediminivivens]NYS26583.1 DEAD/DEAH box helicase family protein [Rhabdonatronobacter sediminivivens]
MHQTDPKRAVAQIIQRLSLRKPQAEALRRLDDIVDLIVPSKSTDVAAARDAVRAAYGDLPDASFEEFERDFPSVCFALATGVGKTRLMGAFISYLYMIGKSRNFFVLAPNLTIYEKLLADFQPTSPKYVFRGIEAFAHNAPLIVNAENYEEGRGVRGTDLFGREGAIINIFNISKINSEVRGGNAPRIKRLQEYIGESYFAYLSGLDDLVLLMDEAHRYRGSAGARAIAELQPILGLEVTATPKTVGARSQAFRNVVYRYGLPEAMEDGYVKEPAVGTRANFDAKSVDDGLLERIKLEDGIHYHEHVKVALETYARQHQAGLVRPFMLVVTQDTTHARQVREFIESDAFFEGRYKGRVAEIHSKLTGEESDENAQRLLNIEKGGDTDIVIHVNKLKEGWDVSNLFTIVPLRASASDILTEQTLGRGLRLPYGKRTGVEVVDTLTVIAHERFNELIEKAREDNGVTRKLKSVTIGDEGDVPASKPFVVSAPSVIEQMVQLAEGKVNPEPAAQGSEDGAFATPAVTSLHPEATAPAAFSFTKREEVNIARTVLSVVLPQVRKQVPSIRALEDPKVIEEIAQAALVVQNEQDGLFPSITADQAQAVTAEVCKHFVERTIAIPTLTITPKQAVSFGFRRFELELKAWNYQPLSRELLIQVLRTEARTMISGDAGGEIPARLEDYLVAKLIDMPEVDYDAHAAVLYDLAGQVVEHFRAKYPDPEQLRSVIQGHARQMAEAVFTQMKQNMWREQTTYRVTVTAAFDQLRPQTFDGSGAGVIRDLRNPPERLQDIRRYVFSGFTKGCYNLAKFDSDPERRLALILEQESTVRLWMKPGPNQFKIFDNEGSPYQPDFTVETTDEKLIIETKRDDQMNAADVLRKADAASLWCYVATEVHGKKVGDKPWSYLLVPASAVQSNATLKGLASAYTRPVDVDLRSRYQMSDNDT